MSSPATLGDTHRICADYGAGALEASVCGRLMTAPVGLRKTVAESRVELLHAMRWQHANFAGNIRGGAILGLMDEVVHACSDSGCHSSWRRWAQGISHSS